ncbi:MAG: NUDIX hydrolase, partial [Promethearchaeota archaeon]
MEKYSFKFDRNLIEKKLLTLNSPKRLHLNENCFIKSAVLFLIIPYENKPYELVMIRRTIRENDKHSGEMAFPGGRLDPQDKSPIDTALRECEEELGIPRENITILGCLDDHITPKGYIITPVVGYINANQKMIRQKEEVDEIVKISINFFANKKNYKERIFLIDGDPIAVGKYNYRAKDGKKYVIFGASCHIIVHFIQIVYNIQLMKPGTRRLRCADVKKRLTQKFIEDVK